MNKLSGECLCGEVKYQIEGDFGDILHCHCSECRKWHGAAFRTRAVLEKKNFQWTQGEDFVAQYDGLSNAIKTFCKQCGSNLVSYYKNDASLVGVPLGGVDGELEKKPAYHIFVGSKAKWFDITDNLPQYNELPEKPNTIHKVKK